LPTGREKIPEIKTIFPQSSTVIQAINNILTMNKIISDKDVFSQVKDKSKKAYVKLWMDFKLFSNKI